MSALATKVAPAAAKGVTKKTAPQTKAHLDALKPTTSVEGKTVQVTGTKGGAISMAATVAKATRLKGADKPAKVGEYGGSQAIKVVTDEGNPHRAGSYRHKAWEALQGCKTAGEYAATGYKTKYLARWAKLGLVRVS